MRKGWRSLVRPIRQPDAMTSVHAGKRTSGHDRGACNFSAIR